MKKNFSKIVLIALCSMFVLSSCDKDSGNEPNPPTPPANLEAPKNIVFNAKTLTFAWDKVKGAEGYQCAVDNILGLALSTVYKENSVIFNSPKRDTWQTFYVRAVNNGVYSENSSFEFIVTDKIILDQPSEFKYDIVERSEKGLRVKFYWTPVNNASKYKYSYTKISGDFSASSDGVVSIPEVTSSWIPVGYKVVVRVRALPAEGSNYVISKEGAAQIKELK